MPEWNNFYTDYAQIVAKAWGDDKLRERLLSNPKEVLREHGYPIADDVQVKVTAGGGAPSIDLPFPEKPPNLDARKIEEYLNHAMGCCCP
jgi:hypothetical protein